MNTLEKQVLEMIGEDPAAPDVFTDSDAGLAQVRGSLNDALEEIALVTGCVRRRYALLLESGKAFYRLRWTGDRFGWVTSAWLAGQRRRLAQTDVMALSLRDPNWMRQSGSPVEYFPVGQSLIGVWPKPGAADVVELDCVVIPARYTDRDGRIEVRRGFEQAAVQRAVSEFWASRGDAKTALYHLARYTELVGLALDYPARNDQPWKLRTDKSGRDFEAIP